MVKAQPNLLVNAERPTLIDEWQRYPECWDIVRRAVDDDHSPGRFILTSSATPIRAPAHSGASRIVPVRMRPLTLFERGLDVLTTSVVDSYALLGEPPGGKVEMFKNHQLPGGSNAR